MDASWLINDLEKAEYKISELEKDVRTLEDKVRSLEHVADFFLIESKNAHLEKTKGGCTPNCPKCIFYKEVL